MNKPITLGEYQTLLEQVLAKKVRYWATITYEPMDDEERELVDLTRNQVIGLSKALRLTDPEKYKGMSFWDGWQDTIPEPPDGWDEML
jgi:hypothetical protein